MVNCLTCKQHVNYVNLRIDKPKCEHNHSLGRWVMCEGSGGSHVFLSKNTSDPCPVCNDKNKINVQKGMKVKCMKIYSNGDTCPTPEYTWFVDGPPCNLNHIDIILVK
ncbi:MAG: hypothetical protein EX285_02300 [Thaumarchaeota archaeon]|nr:hypothetical protein [Nitrososphaerota archaeon]